MRKKSERRARLPQETYTVTIQHDAVTGVVVLERWEKDGLTHREHGPALIARDPTTGVMVHETWYRNSKPHRDDGPAAIRRKPDGRVYHSEWYYNGEKIKPPKPRARPVRSPRAQPISTGPAG